MLKAMLELMRPAHWIKNVFVLAALVFGGKLLDPMAVSRALLALVCFCTASSAVYAFNDLFDREQDRKHPVKQQRPVASGRVSVAGAAGLAAVLATFAVALAFFLSEAFLAILSAYLATNFLYTIWLKRVVILDVMLVATGFVLRVAGGGVVIAVDLSAWLFLCTIFLALLLAFSKRRHELHLLADDAASQRGVLDHYSPMFLDQMINVVTASSVVAYALYSVSPAIVDRFGHRFLLGTIPFVLYGIFRLLYLTYQRPSERNPTEAVLRDLPSVVNVALWGSVVCAMFYRL